LVVEVISTFPHPFTATGEPSIGRSYVDRRAKTAEWVSAFDPGDDTETENSCLQTLQLLRHSTDPFGRCNYDPGHITASALVFSGDRSQILLVWHERLGRWLQPGGHVEATDPSVVTTAAREAWEETDVQLDAATPPVLVGVSVHPIPAARGEPRHLHHDLVFRFLASDQSIRARAEVTEVAWSRIDSLGKYGVDGALNRSIERAVSIATQITGGALQ
jgi:8-oxo-dGTP pyrophosphatase MutT (NUDIX family)